MVGRIGWIGAAGLVLASPALGQLSCGPAGATAIHACLHPGTGPTIVLAAGAGQDSRTWAPLMEEFTSLGSVVSFDRPGLGQSPSKAGARTPTTIAHELREVLAALDVSGPTLLVGHSMGGLHVLRYAELFPESVVGVVLLDTPPPDFENDRMSLLSEREQQERRGQLAEGRERAPAMVGRERDGAESEPWTFADLPGTTPLAVVVADSQDFGDLGSPADHRSLWLQRSERWLALSDRSELVVATGSGHMIHRERPELVLDVVRRLIESDSRR